MDTRAGPSDAKSKVEAKGMTSFDAAASLALRLRRTAIRDAEKPECHDQDRRRRCNLHQISSEPSVRDERSCMSYVKSCEEAGNTYHMLADDIGSLLVVITNYHDYSWC